MKKQRPLKAQIYQKDACPYCKSHIFNEWRLGYKLDIMLRCTKCGALYADASCIKNDIQNQEEWRESWTE